jgi:protein-disulfide isomerase
MKLPRLTPARILVVIVVAAAGVAAALIAISVAGSGGSASNTAPNARMTVYGAAETSQLLAGVPQHANVLGSPKAPVTLVEYADLQCPYCGVWARETFPALVREYVRPGKVKIVFHGLAFVGKDSETALRTVLAAGTQNRLWNVLDTLYRNQGEENKGWVTEELLGSVGESVDGLNAQRMLAERDSASTDSALGSAAQAAGEAGISSTPSFEVGLTGGPLARMEIETLDASAFRPALNELLAS